jgi:hypothetical protein
MSLRIGVSANLAEQLPSSRVNTLVRNTSTGNLDLQKELMALQPGDATCIPYDVYSDLFPPGEPDQGARGRAVVFARHNACTIDNRPTDQIVCFVKNEEAAN